MFESFDFTKHNNDNDRLTRFVKIYEDALTPAECKHLIDFFEESPDKQLGAVWTRDGQEVKPELKLVEQIHLPTGSIPDQIVSTSCGKGLLEYTSNFQFYPPTGATDDGYAVKKYHTGEHYYHWHVDNSAYWTGLRLLAFIWYLNDVAEGGETQFEDINLSVKPRQGRLLIFPTSFLYPHRACIPTSGPKYVVNGFMSYNPPDHDPVGV